MSEVKISVGAFPAAVEIGLKVWRDPVWMGVSERPPGTMTWTPSIYTFSDHRQSDSTPRLLAQLNPDGNMWVDWPLVDRLCVEFPLSSHMENPAVVHAHALAAMRDRRWAERPWSEVVEISGAEVGA